MVFHCGPALDLQNVYNPKHYTAATSQALAISGTKWGTDGDNHKHFGYSLGSLTYKDYTEDQSGESQLITGLALSYHQSHVVSTMKVDYNRSPTICVSCLSYHQSRVISTVKVDYIGSQQYVSFVLVLHFFFSVVVVVV